MPTAKTGAAMTAHGVDLVDEDDAGRLFLGLVKHVANPRRAHTNEHFHKVGAGDGKERHLGLTGDRLGQQGFTRSWLTDHQNTTRNPPTQLLKLARIAEKLNQLLHVFFRFINARNIGKGCCDLIFPEQSRLALAKAHGPATATAAALHLPHEEHKHCDDNQDREAGNEQLGPDALLLGLAPLNLYLMRQQIIDQLGVLNHRASRFKSRPVEALTHNRQAVNSDLANLIALDFLNKLRVHHALGRGLHTEVVENRQQYCGNHKPQEQILGHIVQNHYLVVATAARAGRLVFTAPSALSKHRPITVPDEQRSASIAFLRSLLAIGP